MRSEPHIPLFLWVATALVAHALGGGGATEVADAFNVKYEVYKDSQKAVDYIDSSLTEEL